MNNSKYESEYTRILTAYRSRIAVDSIQVLKKIRGSNRLEGNERNKIDEIIKKWGDKRAVKKLIYELTYDLNSRYDESKDYILEQIIVTLDGVAEKL